MQSQINDLKPSPASPQSRARYARRAANLDSIGMQSRVEAFAGLPTGVKHPDQLLDTFKAAAAALDLPKAAVELIDHLFRRTQPKDWQKGTRPIAWPSNIDLMHSMNRKPTAIGDAIRVAVQHGLLVMKDSPSGKRYGGRDENGAIILKRSFGFDLSPLALRYEEFRKVSTEHRSAHTARMEARRRVTIEREGLFQIIDTASELGVWSRFWDDMAKRAEDTRALLTPTLPLAETEHLAKCLTSWRTEAMAVLEQAVQNRPDDAPEDTRTRDESDSVLSENRQLKNTTDSPLQIDKSREPVEGYPRERSGEGSAQPATTSPVEARSLEAKGITPARIAAGCPVLGGIVGADPSWQHLGLAAKSMAARFDISHRTWGRAVNAVGLEMAVLLFALMASRDPSHFTKNAGAWFAAMIAKTLKGELSAAQLIASYHGMRERTEEGQTPTSAPDAKPSKAFTRKSVGHLAQGILARLKITQH